MCHQQTQSAIAHSLCLIMKNMNMDLYITLPEYDVFKNRILKGTSRTRRLVPAIRTFHEITIIVKPTLIWLISYTSSWKLKHYNTFWNTKFCNYAKRTLCTFWIVFSPSFIHEKRRGGLVVGYVDRLIINIRPTLFIKYYQGGRNSDHKIL